MRTRLSFLLLALVFLLGGCATELTSDIEVNTESDPKANLSAYKTYTWLGSAGILNDPQGLWKPPGFDVDTEVRKLIDAQLQSKGITKSDKEPDLLVGYVVGIDMDAMELKQNPEKRFETLKNVPKGALVVVLIDADTGFPIWVGEAIANVRNKGSDEEALKRLSYAINKMFSNFP